MRDRLLEALDGSDYTTYDASKREFLVYVMGPYKSYPPYNTPPPVEREVTTIRPTLDEISRRIQRGELSLDEDEALTLLNALKRDLRKNTGVNAFLARDPQIPLSEIDAATQSIEYTKAATATIFVAPAMGDNLGVGIETGSVCEHLEQPALRRKILFSEEETVESTMVDAVSKRWHVTVDTFRSYRDLYDGVRAHLRAVAL